MRQVQRLRRLLLFLGRALLRLPGCCDCLSVLQFALQWPQFKPKFNTNLVVDAPGAKAEVSKPKPGAEAPPQPRKRPRSPPLRVGRPESETEWATQGEEVGVVLLALVSLGAFYAQIAALMASMRRDVDVGPKDTGRKKSALEAMIPELMPSERQSEHLSATAWTPLRAGRPESETE
jgi:hypothetical protein